MFFSTKYFRFPHPGRRAGVRSEGAESELGTQGHVVDPSDQIPRPGCRAGLRRGGRDSLGPRCAPRPCDAGLGRRAARSLRPGPRTSEAVTAGTQSRTWRAGCGQAREEGAGEALRQPGFSSESLGLGELGTRALTGGGKSIAEGFVPAAGMPTLRKMEGGMGVSGAAGVGWPGCCWVGEAGDRRIPSYGLRERCPLELQRSSPRRHGRPQGQGRPIGRNATAEAAGRHRAAQDTQLGWQAGSDSLGWWNGGRGLSWFPTR